MPDYITKITGITTNDLKKLQQIENFRKFRIFLGDAVFVAHNANFDFNF